MLGVLFAQGGKFSSISFFSQDGKSSSMSGVLFLHRVASPLACQECSLHRVANSLACQECLFAQGSKFSRMSGVIFCTGWQVL